MQAYTFTRYGPLDSLQFKEVQKPVPGDNEVLLKVNAASVNDWDLGLVNAKPDFMRFFTGFFRPKKEIQIPGCDVAGIVEATGKNVARFKPGDAVFGDLCVCKFGAFADYVCANENALELKSENMTFDEAACFPQAAELAIDALIDVGKLQAGQKLLINGAGGGVGTFGVQLAKLIGAEVTVVDSAIKLDMLRELGADHAIDYQIEDFTRTGQHYDLIVDTKTSRFAPAVMRALEKEGMYATVGGSMWHIVCSLFLFRPLMSLFSSKSYRMVAQKPNNGLKYMNELFEEGKIKAVIDGPYKFVDIREALKHFESAEHLGKVIVTMQ